MIYFRELVTFLSLLAWIEMTTTVMNGNDCFRNGNDCFKWQRPFTKGKIAVLAEWPSSNKDGATCVMTS